MVISPQVKIKRNPEHPTLAEYLADNPSPACTVVGLEHISEFWPEVGVCSDLSRRPYYHCSVVECYNEQGNSRQMMQHLVRRHHVEGWLKDREGRVPATIQGLVLRCREITGGKLDFRNLKVIVNEELWGKCKKARLRLGKEDAEYLFRKENMRTISVISTSISSAMDLGLEKTNSEDGVLEPNSNTRGNALEIVETVMEVDNAILNIPTKVTNDQASNPVVDISDVAPPPTIPVTTGEPPKNSSQFECPECHQNFADSVSEYNNHNLLKHNLPCQLCPLKFTIVKDLEEHSNSIHSNETAQEHRPTLQGINSAQVTNEGDCLSNMEHSERESSSVNQKDISLATLKLSDIDPNVPKEMITAEVMDVSEKEVETLTDSSTSSPQEPVAAMPLALSPRVEHPDLLSSTEYSSKEVPPQSALIEDIVDLTGPQKLSFKEYQEKLRKEKIVHGAQEDVKPYEEDDEVEVIGIKEGNSKANKVVDLTTEPQFKREKPSSTAQPQDLLGEVMVEFSVKAPPPNPMYMFKLKVTNRVKKYLLDYYAKDANDRKDKQGKLRDIKIRDQREFESYCKQFSKKFQAEIFEAYTTINGSEEGIEHVDVNQYGIDHDIEKFFSEIKI